MAVFSNIHFRVALHQYNEHYTGSTQHICM